MMKRVKLFCVEFVVTDEDRVMVAEDGEEVLLSEELGWWDREGRVWVWGNLKWYEKWGVGVHEVVEFVLEDKLGFSHEKAHKIANRVEQILTLGKSKVY